MSTVVFDENTKVINIRDCVPYDVYIGRGVGDNGSKWGNPYSTKSNSLAKYKVKNKKEALEKYREYILNTPHLYDALEELNGKTLGCFCKPSKCHGDILIELLKIKLKTINF